MKQKDIILIIVLSIFSGVIAILLSRFFFAKPSDRQQKAEVVSVITSEFPAPPSRYFNANSIDPTQLIHIGEGTNPSPFKDNE